MLLSVDDNIVASSLETQTRYQLAVIVMMFGIRYEMSTQHELCKSKAAIFLSQFPSQVNSAFTKFVVPQVWIAQSR